MSAKKVKLVLCWHMHQPSYFDVTSEEYILPWTYLHAIKDYVDMAWHLEQVPDARAVVNFAPVLLEQLDDYADQLEQWQLSKTALRDPMLSALAAEDLLHYINETRFRLIESCLRANEERLINRFPQFKQLARLAHQLSSDEMSPYISEQFLVDLLVWYHLAWMGETVRRSNSKIKQLIKKEKNFSIEDRHSLLQVIAELMAQIIPRYRQLLEQGKVELAFSPYAHPIVPLLLNFESARQAEPDKALPRHKTYAKGLSRAKWHFRQGIQVFEKYFGDRPYGCWPSEGSICDDTIVLCAEMGIKWIASGENVLNNSLHKANETMKCKHRAFQLNEVPVSCFFRDDGLSDLIGFSYSKWHADDAVNNLIHHIENIAEACHDKDNTVISIILDGENAWEYYPENAYYFLSALYTQLAEHSTIELTTFSQALEGLLEPVSLPHFVAGSWVYGTFSTWIGDKEKNLAWDLLCDAKLVFDEVMKGNELDESQRQQATQQLAICEGSDWFWWFGDYNPGESVKEFDRLYRRQLRRLYELLQRPAPLALDKVISVGGGSPAAGGVMRHGSET